MSKIPEVWTVIMAEGRTVMSNEEQQVKARLERQLAGATDLHPYIGAVRVFFYNDQTAHSEVIFDSVWPCGSSPTMDDCGGGQVPFSVSLRKINFDAKKWRKYFREQLLKIEFVGGLITHALSTLTSARFLSDNDVVSIVNNLNYLELSKLPGRWQFSLSATPRIGER